MQLKIAVLGSEKVIFGFKIAGFSPEENVLHIIDEDFDEDELISTLKDILSREDIGLVFITENLFDLLENDLLDHKKLLPSVLKIPTWI